MVPRKVLLVGWDAADWKVIQPLLGDGKMPNVRRLIENGASGQIATLHPPLSPILWTSIATGKRPFKHGILGFSEPTPNGQAVQPVSNLSRTSKAIWNILNQNGLRSIVIGWWPSHPAEPIDGVMVSDHYHRASGPLEQGWPLPPNTVHPPTLAAKLADLRVHPDVLTAPMVEAFIPRAKETDQDRDKRLALCLRTLAECMSVQSAAAWLLDQQPWDFFAVYFDAIDHFCHGFMKYHPPRQPWIGERDFELYKNVVSMAYELHDRMLGELLEKAGEDATVILLSDHGFHPDHLRPASIPDIPAGPAVEHRDLGVFAILGPGIKPRELLHGASILDVAPTILSLFGLPVGEDMDGKVLSPAFAKTPKVDDFIRSWEEVPGPDGRHPPHTRHDPIAAQAALERMVELGYIEPPDQDRAVAVEKTIRELRYNLGQAFQDDARHTEAHEIFSELRAADPSDQRFAVRLFISCQALRLHSEMRGIVDSLDSSSGPPAIAGYLQAQLAIAERRYGEALSMLEKLPGLWSRTADLYLRLRRWSDARQTYEKALAVDPDNPHAHLGLCQVALRQKNFSLAAQKALDALQRAYHDPQGHFSLGLALTGMKEYQRAADAFRAAISFNPNFPEAHVRLAGLLEKHLGDGESAREHRRLARCMRRSRSKRAINPLVEQQAKPQEIPSPPGLDEMPALTESLIVVSGLPRSGTSLLMQMLAAGGLGVLSDGLREADEDNPRGYLEFERVKNLAKDSQWLCDERGKAVKIVAPLLSALPAGLPCRVILSERDLDEVLDSQERMLARRNRMSAKPGRRQVLKEEYSRTLARVKAMLVQRPSTRLLVIEHSRAISDPLLIARQMNEFLGGGLDVAKMAAAVEPALHHSGYR